MVEAVTNLSKNSNSPSNQRNLCRPHPITTFNSAYPPAHRKTERFIDRVRRALSPDPKQTSNHSTNRQHDNKFGKRNSLNTFPIHLDIRELDTIRYLRKALYFRVLLILDEKL